MLGIDTSALRLSIRTTAAGDEIFDVCRKKWVHLTPEEWVRQTLLGYLIQQARYPSAMIAVEKAIAVGDRVRRFDALIYNRAGQPWMLIECKAPEAALGHQVIGQLLAYQTHVGASFLVISNGSTIRCWQVVHQQVLELDFFPPFPL